MSTLASTNRGPERSRACSSCLRRRVLALVAMLGLGAGCSDGRSAPLSPALPLDENPSNPDPALVDAERFQQALAEVRSRLPHDGFTALAEPPFLVMGDEDPQTVQQRAEHTVRWAVEMLRESYFDAEPAELLEIWMFKDHDSYVQHTRLLFDEEPRTPFGYYAPRHGALIMNIATGGGTLVHEIVHPFVAADFPGCPPWFNEGLGSLFEQCAEREGRIVGLTNWRLAGLKRALEEDRVPSFRTLMELDGDGFYGDDQGVHYALARYVCFYLQERGLLESYYRAFRDARADDPSGYQTFEQILGGADMSAVRSEWESFVRALRFGS